MDGDLRDCVIKCTIWDFVASVSAVNGLVCFALGDVYKELFGKFGEQSWSDRIPETGLRQEQFRRGRFSRTLPSTSSSKYSVETSERSTGQVKMAEPKQSLGDHKRHTNVEQSSGDHKERTNVEESSGDRIFSEKEEQTKEPSSHDSSLKEARIDVESFSPQDYFVYVPCSRGHPYGSFVHNSDHMVFNNGSHSAPCYNGTELRERQKKSFDKNPVKNNEHSRRQVNIANPKQSSSGARINETELRQRRKKSLYTVLANNQATPMTRSQEAKLISLPTGKRR